jgi:riboflavin synthase
MFTGIIEKTVRLMAVTEGPRFRRLILAAPWSDLQHGDSVALNGVCLTIADLSKPGEIGFDVIYETLQKTNLGLLKQGDEVHAERALRVGDRLDGHFVQGHVDGTAPLLERIDDEKEVRLRIQCPHDLAKYLMPKGSVSLDGVSLTIAAVKDSVFEVALIPTTLNLTTLGRRNLGWPFNLETDVLSKTIVTWLERQQAK